MLTMTRGGNGFGDNNDGCPSGSHAETGNGPLGPVTQCVPDIGSCSPAQMLDPNNADCFNQTFVNLHANDAAAAARASGQAVVSTVSEPFYKKPLFWGLVAGGVVAIGAGYYVLK